MTIPLVTITLVRTASFSIYTWTKDDLQRRNLLTGETVGSTALAGFLGGAASGLLLSVGTTAFEYTKIKLRASNPCSGSMRFCRRSHFSFPLAELEYLIA